MFIAQNFLLTTCCALGPILGGLLADPAGNYPATFGSIAWLNQWPYALPNLVSAVFLFLSSMVVLLGLEEVNDLEWTAHLLVADMFTVARTIEG